MAEIREVRVNNVPMSQVSTARSTERSRRSLNLQPLRVERSRNPKPLVLYFDASPFLLASSLLTPEF
jgi:hypothetical protein